MDSALAIPSPAPSGLVPGMILDTGYSIYIHCKFA